MSRTFSKSTRILAVLALVLGLSATSYADPKKKDVLKAMDQATDFMMNTVSTNGGFVWKYTADLSERWGEIPARDTMIWVQDPGTIGVGTMLIGAYKGTGDEKYIEYARRVANALIWGQYPSGGWHYLIDFDMTEIEEYYENVASKCWGWEEYYHYYGNCTFDDNVTTGATRFLMNMYLTTLDPAYYDSTIKALNFILESQYPNGAWPQRYPISNEYPHDGHGDYTPYYTYNDDVIQGNIHLLIEAWQKLGNVEYKKAADRGMYFIIISQLGAPQAGWGQQYDMDMNSAAARSYEPASVMPSQTVRCCKDLMLFYKITGKRRFLRGIPEAIEWIESSYLPDSDKQNDRITHATFYEIGTNKPIYAHREGTSKENGHYYVDYVPKNFPGHCGMQTTINVDALRLEYERVNALSPEEAMAEYKAEVSAKPSVPSVDPDKVEQLIKNMDDRGAWVEELNVPDYSDPVKGQRRKFSGISTATYIRNMRTLINYTRGME